MIKKVNAILQKKNETNEKIQNSLKWNVLNNMNRYQFEIMFILLVPERFSKIKCFLIFSIISFLI